MNKIECKCTKSFVTIDENSLTVICDVTGIVDYKDVRVKNGTVTCIHCNNVIYQE